MRNVAKLVVVTLFVMLLGTITAEAQVSVSIGIDLPAFPRLEVVPNYPVYYAPSVRANYFFYDGLFWDFNVEDGYWYSSSWYNGPWVFVEPVYVPQVILVIPYRYYRVRPRYWSGWDYDRPPRWGNHWGPQWESSRRDWERWDRTRTYVAAPLPAYQRKYDKNHYPAPSQQITIRSERYRYEPKDDYVRQQQTTILERQSHGGERARDKAERVVKGPDPQEKTQRQEKAQGQEKYKEKGQRQDKSQLQEKGQRQDKAPPQEKARQEKALPQEKYQGQNQDKSQPPEKAQRQDKSQPPEKAQRQENGQRQEKSQPQEKGQRQEKGQEKGT
jgi:hypothetical protein